MSRMHNLSATREPPTQGSTSRPSSRRSAGSGRLQDDELLDGFDRVPTDLLAMLARDHPTRFPGSPRELREGPRDGQSPAVTSTTRILSLGRMQAVFHASRDPDIKALALAVPS